jgi:hypothetical protein
MIPTRSRRGSTLRADGETTLWLAELEMAKLFAAAKDNISVHLTNLFEDRELDEDSVIKESLTTAAAQTADAADEAELAALESTRNRSQILHDAND